MQYITAKEAAEILNITVRQLHREVRKGMLRQLYPKGYKTPYYDPEEVSILHTLRKKKISLPEVASLAQQAHMRVMHLEKLVEQLIKAVGADIPHLPLDKESVTALWYKAQQALEEPHRHTLKEILEWSGIFSSIGEEHLMAIESHMTIADPYKVFVELGVRMFKEYPYNHDQDPGTSSVFRMLNVSRDKLRRAIWSYVSLSSDGGKFLACKMFPKSRGDVHDDILALVIEKRRKRDIGKRFH